MDDEFTASESAAGTSEVPSEPPAPSLPPAAADDDDRLLPTAEIERALGQTVGEALNLAAWEQHGGLRQMLSRIGQFVGTTVQADRHMHELLRDQVLRRLPEFTDAPAEAGVYQIKQAELRAALRNHLLPGRATAVQGVCTGHEAQNASIISIGVSLVRYDGQQRSWRTTLLRHDYDLTGGDSLEVVRRFLNRQHPRSAAGVSRDQLTNLLRRGFLAAAQRQTLLQKAASPWRMGRGVPAPLELLTGGGSTALLEHVLPILEDLLLKQDHWVFLPTSDNNPALVAMASGLNEGELAILVKGKASLQDIVDRAHVAPAYRQRVLDFANRLGEDMVIGGFRATRHAPAQLFIAHRRHALPAGVIAMADAQLQPHRGVPLLLDLAAESAKVGLGIEAFQGAVQSAYARAGASPNLRPVTEEVQG